MDRIMAGDLLTKHDTNWQLWTDKAPGWKHKDFQTAQGSGDNWQRLHDQNKRRRRAEEQDQHVSHVLGHMREGGRKFLPTPKVPRGQPFDSCRIFGSLEGNKVQGDFHITARGHGYLEFGGPGHLDHSTFNFSHRINELSFGPHYPNLLNPLDKTSSTTEHNFFRFQYYLSIVPTIFTKRRVSTKSGTLNPAAIPQPPTLDMTPHTGSSKDGIIHHVPNPHSGADSQSIFTNQYAATSQSRLVGPTMIPGIFFKFDIEPILLIVSEQRGSFLALVVRLVNVISGVLVGGGWTYQLTQWVGEVVGRRRRAGSFVGGGGTVLHP
jgi:endoplasmic reticulum-Golgi intermediate compartment protein 2